MFSMLFFVASILLTVSASAIPMKRDETCTPNARGDTVQFASDFDGRKITIGETHIYRLEQDGNFPSNFLSPTDWSQTATIVDDKLEFGSVSSSGANDDQLFEVDCNICDANGFSLSVASGCMVKSKASGLCLDASDFTFSDCNRADAFHRYSVDKRTE
ncbi:hypothetical protein PM082_006550 [Marasmius tenuissimus]|nr:hypothetical protein PM082_006550 [Marasmius tenuissimus]